MSLQPKICWKILDFDQKTVKNRSKWAVSQFCLSSHSFVRPRANVRPKLCPRPYVYLLIIIFFLPNYINVNHFIILMSTLTSGQFERLQRMKRERDFSVWQNSKKKTKVEMLPSKPIQTKVDKRRPMIKESMVMQENGSRVKERSLFKRFIKFMK